MASDKILEKVRQMLAIAEHPNTPVAEAEVAYAQANRLIAKHAIDEAILAMSQTAEERTAPERRTVKLAERTTEFAPYLRTLLHEIAMANRCRVALSYIEADLFGAHADVAWTEMLYTSVYFQFIGALNPKWDSAKSYDENVYSFKVAGYKWVEINDESRRNDGPDARIFDEYGYSTGKIKGTMIAAYKRWAKAIGDTSPVSTQSHRAYRDTFAKSFQYRLATRIRAMAHASDQERDSTAGAALALIDHSKHVDDAFYSAYPQFDPETLRKQAARDEARRREEERKHNEWLDSLTPSERSKYYEKQEREERRIARANDKYYEEQSRKFDGAGADRGRKAADSVDLSRKAGSAGSAPKRGEIG